MPGQVSMPPTAFHSPTVGRADASEDVVADVPRPSRYRKPNHRTSYTQQEQGDGSNRNVFNLPYKPVDAYSFQHSDQISSGGRYDRSQEAAGVLDPQVSRKTRQRTLVVLGRRAIMLMAFVFAAVSLYWGVFYHAQAKLGALEVHVVDFDGQMPPYDNITAIVGPAVTDLTREIHTSPSLSSRRQPLGYRIIPAAEYGHDPMAVRRAVFNREAWAAVVVSANATALLLDAVTLGNASYEPATAGALQYVVQTARDETTAFHYVLPELQALTDRFLVVFGTRWTHMLLTNTSFSPVVMARASAAVNPGVMPLKIDLRPFEPATAGPAVATGLIFLMTIAFFSPRFFAPPKYDRDVILRNYPLPGFWKMTAWRWAHTVLTYLLVSLAYSLVCLAFGVPSADTTSFAAYWMVSFDGMAALGLISENMRMALGRGREYKPWLWLWLAVWAVINVTAATASSSNLTPSFYAWTQAFPLHHVAQASRHIIFNVRSDLALNFGVLLAWTVAGTALFPLCLHYELWCVERERGSRRNGIMEAKRRYVVRHHVSDGGLRLITRAWGRAVE